MVVGYETYQSLFLLLYSSLKSFAVA